MSNGLPDFDLETYLPYQMTVLAARLSAGLAQRYKSKFGISIAEWRVLVNVGYTDSLSVRDIEKRVSLEKSKVSRAASKLEAKGYLIKTVDDKDRRLLRLTLTPKGVALLQKLIPLAEEFQNELRTQLGKHNKGLTSALSALMTQTD